MTALNTEIPMNHHLMLCFNLTSQVLRQRSHMHGSTSVSCTLIAIKCHLQIAFVSDLSTSTVKCRNGFNGKSQRVISTTCMTFAIYCWIASTKRTPRASCANSQESNSRRLFADILKILNLWLRKCMDWRRVSTSTLSSPVWSLSSNGNCFLFTHERSWRQRTMRFFMKACTRTFDTCLDVLTKMTPSRYEASNTGRAAPSKGGRFMFQLWEVVFTWSCLQKVVADFDSWPDQTNWWWHDRWCSVGGGCGWWTSSCRASHDYKQCLHPFSSHCEWNQRLEFWHPHRLWLSIKFNPRTSSSTIGTIHQLYSLFSSGGWERKYNGV